MTVSATALSVAFAVLVNRKKIHVSKIRIIVSSFIRMLTYCITAQLIVCLIMGEFNVEFASILPVFAVFFLGIFALAAIILSLSAII